MLDASPAPTFDLEAFRAWLVANGAEIFEYDRDELFRARTRLGILVFDKVVEGRLTGPENIGEVVDAFLAGDSLNLGGALAPTKKKRVRTKSLQSFLIRRDGPGCWYCGCDGAMTFEHLVAKSRGGPHHTDNLVLACHPCNQEADVLSVAEKVRLREAKRAKGGKGHG